MGYHAILVTLELLHVAATFGAPRDPVGNEAFEIQVNTVGAALREGIASNFPNLSDGFFGLQLSRK